MRVSRNKIIYSSDKELEKVDLRPDGIDCIPLFGRSSFTSLREGTDMHVHEGCTEVCLCLKGNLRFESLGQEYPFYPGRVFVSNSNEPHQMISAPKGLKLFHLLFKVPSKGTSVLGLPAAESRWLVNRLTHFPVRLFPASERVKNAFERVHETYLHNADDAAGRRLKMRAAVLEMLLALVEAPILPPKPQNQPARTVRLIAERIRQDCKRAYPIDELSAEAALSTVAFSDAFKRETGLPPHAFLINCRLESVRRELESGDQTVTALAARYGFSSQRHLTTSFKKMFGMSPTAIRALRV